ncbi:MAG TPA: ribonuclease H-like domain-containing protein [Mariprofundaceae bacterium]|nr:ribonuclease H-like domain-containing protein [Mariprofundaceae bacterium]
MSWAAKWLDKKSIQFMGLNKHSKEDMIEGIYDLVDAADVVVHYNGTKFDMPTLNQEFALLGLSKPSPYKQVDLLRTVRKQFRLPSNKLSYVSMYLGLGDKTQHKGMGLWRECMAGDPRAWKTMETYNKQDVVLLEKMYNKLKPWIDGHPNVALYDGDETVRCPRCGGTHLQKRGYAYTPTMKYQQYHCQDCGAWSRARLNSMEKEKRASILVEAK